MYGSSARAANEVMQGDFDCRLGAMIAIHAAVHGGKTADNIGRFAISQRRN
jgi:hypothetical protein